MKFQGVVPELCGAKVVRRVSGLKARGGAWKIRHIGLGPHMGTYSNTQHNGLIALYRRVLYRYDKRTGEYGERIQPSDNALRSIDESLSRFAQRTNRSFDCPLKVERFPELYSGAKRTLYGKAAVSLARDPRITPRDARNGAFIKVEPTELGADPRLIQAKSPRYHVAYGCYIKPMEKQCYRGVDRVYGETTIVKGLNGEQVGALIAEKFNSFERPCAIGLDASRFDRSVSASVLECLFRYYRTIVGRSDARFEELLSWQLRNRGRITTCDGIVDYTVEGGVMSGDMDTSLKGCVIMCALVLAWSTRVGTRIKLVNNGDDCVVFMDQRDEISFRSGMTEWMLDAGFDIVAEPTALRIEHIEFCQARPVLDSRGGYVMCRNPIKATTKDTMSRVDLRSDKVYRRWLKAVGECGMALAGDMPIFGVYYARYIQLAGDVDIGGVQRHGGFVNGLYWASRGMDARYGVTDATRLSFWEAWGIPPHIQRLLEEYYTDMDLSLTMVDPAESAPQTRFQAPLTLQRLCSNG